MSASEARKLARTALGMAPAGGIREELRADLEAAEAEFARRLKVRVPSRARRGTALPAHLKNTACSPCAALLAFTGRRGL